MLFIIELTTPLCDIEALLIQNNFATKVKRLHGIWKQ